MPDNEIEGRLAKVGFLSNGNIFLSLYGQMDGKPTETFIQWSPKEATNIRDGLNIAIEKAQQVTVANG